METIHKVKLVRTHPSRIHAAESAEVFEVTGRGVRNREYDHRIRAFIGRCCDESRLHLHLSAEAKVISQHVMTPERPVTRLSVAMGGVIHVDYTDYRVCARVAGDPILIPVIFNR